MTRIPAKGMEFCGGDNEIFPLHTGYYSYVQIMLVNVDKFNTAVKLPTYNFTVRTNASISYLSFATKKAQHSPYIKNCRSHYAGQRISSKGIEVKVLSQRICNLLKKKI